MNNQRFNNQHTNGQSNTYGNRSQSTNQRDQQFRKAQLERELRYLERDLVALDVQIDALGRKGQLLDAEKHAHMQRIPGAIAQVALSTLGVRYLPPVARSWYYKHQHLQQADFHLRQHALHLHTRREMLTAQIEQLTIQLEMLQFEP